jgi:hypothetical protein
MNSWSSWAFIVLTCFYFYIKNKSNKESYSELEKGITPYSLFTFVYFFSYIILVIICQIGDNTAALNEVCSDSNNYVRVVYCCLAGWILIFLVMVGVIFFTSSTNINMISCFADVFGYFWVAKNMNIIFSTIMYPTSELKNKIVGSENKEKLELAAETIMKTTNSYFLFVNKFTPYNFEQMWSNLSPLMKDDLGSKLELSKEELYYLVLLRHNIGECFWYLYTGIFVCSYVSYIVLQSDCNKSITQLEDDMDDIPESDNKGPQTFIQTHNPTL